MGEPIAIIAKRGDVSATIEWDDELFVFRFRDGRAESKIMGAAREWEFSWSPECGLELIHPDGSDKGPPDEQA